jgi:hypothetical protein
MEELDYVNGYRPKELHTIIVWDKAHKFLADDYLLYLVKQGSIKIVSKKEVALEPTIEKILAKTLYDSNDSRAVNHSIYLIILEDQNPVYKYEKATSCKQVLNYNMFIIKRDLRNIISEYDQNKKSIYYYLHTSYNTEETDLVLNSLNLKAQFSTEKQFQDLKNLFSELNSHKRLKYVIQRSFKELGNIQLLRGKDIDILVNDYYLFKEITKAKSKNKKLMREKEDGYFIQNDVIIGNRKVAFDVRYLGDGYNDYVFEKDTLESRRLTTINGLEIYIPNSTYQLYTLLYNVLIQKSGITKKRHVQTIAKLYKELGKEIEFNFRNFKNGDKAVLWEDLFSFMKKNSYRIVKPKDGQVKVNIPDKYRKEIAYSSLIDEIPKENFDFVPIEESINDINNFIPYGHTIIFVDECQWMIDNWLSNHKYFPFIERKGKYWGNPVDSSTAIKELTRLCKRGASHIVIASPAFWWFDYYNEFYDYLCTGYSCILKNDRMVIFDLGRKPTKLEKEENHAQMI